MITDAKLAAILSAEAETAVTDWNTTTGKEQTKALRYYNGDSFEGDDDKEMAGWSKVVSRDVAEVVDWSLPELIKLFLEREKVAEFEPRRPDQEAQCDQASEYLDYVFFEDNDGFNIIHDQIKDGLLQKVGIVRVFWDEAAEATRETIEGIDEAAAAALAEESGRGEVEILAVEDGENGEFNVRIERREMGRVVIDPVPPENFLVSRNGDDPDTVPYIAARFRKTASELIADGYDRDVVQGLNDTANSDNNTGGDYERSKDDNGLAVSENEDKSQQEYWVFEEYARVDVDDDGEAELIHAVRVGSTILEWEEVSEQPFCIFTPNRMPHRIVGRSMADDAMDVQEIKSTLWREALDNQGLANRPQREVPDAAMIPDTTVEDLMNPRIGGIIRTRGQGGMIRDLVAPDVSGSSLGMIEYADRVKESRTGVSRHQQGLESDTLHSTKGGMERLMSEGQGRRDLIARHYASTLRKMVEKAYRLICRHQDKERVIRLRGEWVPMDPRSWDAKMTCTVKVGIGTASDAEKRQNAMTLVTAQREAMMAGMVTPEQMMKGLEKFTETLNLGPVEMFFSEPQQQGQSPEDARAQQEMQAKQQELQLKQQELELKAQMQREKAQLDVQLAREKMEIETELRREEMQAQIDLKYAEIAIKGQTNENIRSPVQ